MTTYSPSQTTEWMECPLRRALRYLDGWEPRRITRPRLAAALGSAFAAGVAHYNANGRDASNAKAAGEVAYRHAAAQLRAWQDAGREVVEWEATAAARLAERAQKGVLRYIEVDPIPQTWRVVAVEATVGDERARPDLVVEAPAGGGLVVVDYKTKLTLDARYRQDTREEYAHSWQLRHYCWRWETRRYAIVLVVLEPRFSVEWIPFDVTPQAAEVWQLSAQTAWADMAAEDRGERLAVARPTSCRGRYGWCEYRRACPYHGYDPEAMPTEYVRVRAPEAT